MNLRRALEEEMADVPCDICGSQDHDYHHCQAGALLESQMPGTSQPGQNDDRGNLSQGPPCGWCEKKGHISLECSTKFYSQSMKERFPKMKKKRKSKSWNTLAEGVGSNTLSTGTARTPLNHP